MGNKQKAVRTAPTGQLRASAESSGKNGSKSFSSVSPVQKKEDAVQRVDEKELEGLSMAPAQMAGGDLEKELE